MKMVTLILLPLAVLITCPLNYVRGRKGRIIGGIDPKPEDIKFLVSMQIRGWHMCGGGIIGDKFILTAAHCVINTATYRFIKGPWQIIGGTNNYNDSNAIVADVEKIFVPESFFNQKKFYNLNIWDADIAVLRLKQSLNLKTSQRLLKLHLATEPKSLVNLKGKVSGFGTDRYERYESVWGGPYDVSSESGQAHQINVTVIEPAECRQFTEYELPNTEFCARISEPNDERPAGTCIADSGSPMVYNDDIVVGVTVRSEKPCNQNVKPGYYTRVSSYVNFINDAMNDVIDEIRIIEV